MNKTNLIIFMLVILLSALGLTIYLQGNAVPEQIVLDVQPDSPPEPKRTPIVHYPVPESMTEQHTPPPQQEVLATQPVKRQLPKILPTVQESDQSIQKALKNLFSEKAAYKLLYIENFIQKVVATIDNLPEKQLPRAHLPIKAPGGKFLVAGTPEAPQTSSRNNKRYGIYLTLLESINQELSIKIYTHFYPLFQTAYEQLGYKNAYFNDRLVYVVDHLLETPNPHDPIQLAQPAVFFTYADPNLENLSSGQKILLRIGHEQRSRVLKILADYRHMLTNLEAVRE
ncbi:MAG: DUF3014 domain-containing protein [Thermodesulfobacteriota bacterium]|nr:DUF3014 domain-containing protein [Thermodesulfobacteriota bacterium]